MTKSSYPKTISDLTNGKLTTLKYNLIISSIFPDAVKGDYYPIIYEVVNKLGGSCENVNYFSLELQKAVKSLQTQLGLSPNGIIDNQTWAAFIDALPDDNVSSENNTPYTGTTEQDDGAFFNKKNSKMYRRSGHNIKIVFGNDTITKTIVNVHIRSVSVEVDTSGNPISEVYEFVAKDIYESDEPNDSLR